MLTLFQSKRDADLGRISTIKHRVDLGSPKIRPTHVIAYSAGIMACDFERSKIKSMQDVNMKNLAQTDSAPAVVFAPSKHSTLRFCADYT